MFDSPRDYEYTLTYGVMTENMRALAKVLGIREGKMSANGVANAAAVEIERLRTLLRTVEWAGDFCDGPACPVCLGAPHKGHARDCELAAALEGA